MAKKRENVIKEATRDDERLQMSVRQNQSDEVEVRGRKYKVRWMHPGTMEWITSLVLKDGNDAKILCQASALIVLNGFWKCHLFYWIVWRWFYYIRQYNASELEPLIQTAQKKTQQEVSMAYLSGTMLLTALKDTTKQMTKAEAERTLQELRSVSDGKSPISTASTQAPSESSASPSAE